MSRSKPRDLCWFIKMEYEKKYPGMTYAISSRDMGEAKQFIDANGDPDYEYLAKCLPQFWASEFWEDQRHPAWAFFKHIMRYAPKVERVSKPSAMMVCGGCGQVHGVNEKCKPQVNA